MFAEVPRHHVCERIYLDQLALIALLLHFVLELTMRPDVFGWLMAVLLVSYWRVSDLTKTAP